ncbi:MAG: hypothetical protein ACO3CL_08495, partial [Bacteroidia bacterium]
LTTWWTSTPDQRAGPGCFPNRRESTAAWLPSHPRRRPSLYRIRVSQQGFTPSLDGRIQIGLEGPSTALVSLDVTDWTGKSLFSICNQTLADSLSTWFWDGSKNSGTKQDLWSRYGNGHTILRLNWEDAEGRRGWDMQEIYLQRP